MLSNIFDKIQVVKNFPKPGITFRHIGPLLNDAKLFKYAMQELYSKSNGDYDVVCGLDARGFIISTAIQYIANVDQVMIRKQSKLPGEKYVYEYKKEYGSDILELEHGYIKPGQKVLIVDDLMATAGTLIAAANLVEQSGGIVSGIMVLIEFNDLSGRSKLSALYPNANVYSLFSLNSYSENTKLEQINKQQIKKFRPTVYPLNDLCINNPGISLQDKKIINVYVATTNKVKLNAVYEASLFGCHLFPPLGIHYCVHSVEGVRSEVPEQPYGIDETTEGANNRLENCYKIVKSDNGIFISVENGIIRKNNTYYDIPIIAFRKGARNDTFSSNEVEIPKMYDTYVEESINSENRSVTFGSIIEKKLAITDWHEFVSGKSRKNLIKNCIMSIELLN